jgi:hypothetical protein
MRMKEEYSSRWEMRAKMENTLDGGARSDRISSAQFLSLTSLIQILFLFYNLINLKFDIVKESLFKISLILMKHGEK